MSWLIVDNVMPMCYHYLGNFETDGEEGIRI